MKTKHNKHLHRASAGERRQPGVVTTATACSLVAVLALSSCQLPKQMSSAPSGDVNDSSTVLTDEYTAKGRTEIKLDSQIEDSAEAFLGDATTLADDEKPSKLASSFSGGSIPTATWWSDDSQRSVLDHTGKTVRMGLDEIYQRTLANSSQVRVFASLPLIRETGIDVAKGEFDPEFFAQGRYDSTHEPTGSVLEAGEDVDFFLERGWLFEAGIRKKFMPGTTLALTQELTSVTNNSEFFTPDEQTRSRLKLSVMQPLLKGAGVNYNRTYIQIAKLDADSGYDEFIRQLETHLMEVNRSYWSLYLARALYLEKQRLVAETEEVVTELENRDGLDTIASQRTRARAAFATRKADLIRSELAIKNAESRLRALINDPMFIEQRVGEIITQDMPVAAPVMPDFDESVAEALAYRPEIRQAENRLRAANLREGVARNEKRPTLNAIGEVGISSLVGGSDWGQAYSDQYDDSEPTWGAGLVASVPWGRRSAKARHLRTQLEIRQQKDQLRSTMDTVLLELQIAYREVTTAWPDARAKWEAAEAAEAELVDLEDRRNIDAVGGASVYLEHLLDAQERRTLARDEFLRALVVYNASLTNLERARGTLLQHEEINVERTEDEEHLPLIELTKAQAAEHAIEAYASYK